MLIGSRLRPSGLSAATERMLRHPVLSATTDMMLLQPIYQLLLEGGNNPLQDCFFPRSTLQV